MAFTDNMEEEIDKIRKVYDLAAFCYDYLVRTVGDQARFIGTYIWENESANTANPNLDKLRKFSGVVEHVLQKREESGYSFLDCLSEIQRESKKITLEEYGEELLNDASIPFYILRAIDRYVLVKRGRCFEAGPLNKGYCKKSYIYLNIGDSMLEEASQANHFPDVIRDSSIGNQFDHLIILEKKELPEGVNPPRVVSLQVDEEDREKQGVCAGKKLKIAVIPFDRKEMVCFPVDCGGLFHVEYKAGHLETGVARALELLEEAVSQGANIVLFPEYVCSQEIQSAIRKRLGELHQKTPQKLSRLLFVVAGSGWTEDGNNVSRIFSGSGKLLGSQYKYSKYCDWKEKGRELVENLQNPGKETTMIEVDGLGKVLVGICRDVSARLFTRSMARLFSPQLLLVPAWSRSVDNGFREQFQEITAENHRTCSVLCNCCEAVNNKEKFREQIGLVVTPCKKGTVVTGKARNLCRVEDKCARHCEADGCIFMIEMDFGSEAVEQGKIAKHIRRIFG